MSCQSTGHELLALREEFASYITRSSDDWMALELKYERARMLLSQWRHHWINDNEAPEQLAAATRAFLEQP